jgi:outer membrane receptor protein involved in Fe transport
MGFFRDQGTTDVEVAGFAEANYWLTERLRATAGVRVSRVTFDYDVTVFGQAAGIGFPTLENGGRTQGSATASPVTPKLGLQYQLNKDDMFYVTAAKGFRAGGVNAPLPQGTCGAGLASLGLTSRDIPTTYGPDTVWSYEAGAKLRLLDNRVQVNSSVYRVDWSEIQLAVSTPGCGPTYTNNAGTARSQGFDTQVQARLFAGLTFNGSVGYTNAKYQKTVLGPRPLSGAAASPIVLEGQALPVPKWQVTVGGQYDFEAASLPMYVRADYQYSGKWFRGPPPGHPAYQPDTRQAEATNQVNLRVGVTVSGWEGNVFVNNVLNSDDVLAAAGGRNQCVASTGAACTSYGQYNPFISETTMRPREIGVQVSKRW